MRRLWLIVGLLLVVCGGAIMPTSTPISAQSGTPTPSPTMPPVVINETVSIDATGRYYYPQITSTLRLQVPTIWPEVATMRQHAFGTKEYRDAARMLLSNAGVFGAAPPQVTFEAIQGKGQPELTIDNDVATILIATQGSLYGRYLQWLPVGGIIITYGDQPARATDSTTGVTTLSPGDLTVRVARAPSSGDATRTVELRFTGMDVVSAMPIPSRDTGAGNLVWSSRTLPGQDDIVVATRLRPITKAILATQGNWVPTAQSGLSYLPSLVVAIAFVYLTLSRRWRGNLWPAVGPGAVRLRNVSAASVAFICTIGAIAVFDSQYDPPYDRYGLYRQILLELHFLLPLLLFLVATRMLRYPGPRWRDLHWAVAALLSFVLLNLPILAARVAPPTADAFGKYSWIDHHWTAWWPILALLMLVLTLSLLAGMARLLIALWPDDGVRARLRDTRKLHAGVVAVAALFFALWLLNTWQSASTPWLTWNGENAPLRLGTLVWELTFYPVQLESALRALLPLAVLFSVVGVLYALHVANNTLLFTDAQRWVPVALALLFAGFIVGTDDNFAGFAIPIGFVIALSLMCALRAKPDAVEATVADAPENAALPADQRPRIGRYQREFLLRVRGLEALKRQRTALEADYSGGKLGYAEYAGRSIKADDEQKRLTRGAVTRQAGGWVNWKTVTEELPARVYLPAPLSPHRLALTTGPENTWWENGRTAVRIALWLIAPPLAYVIYLVLSRVYAQGQSAYVFWSFLVTGFINSAARWLVLAFVMGCLYPYLRGANGVLKGVSLAAIYAVAVAPGDIWDATFGMHRNSTAVFDVALLLVFVTVIGATMDWRTLRMRQLPGASLVDYYQLRNIRNLIAYVVPLVLAAVTIVSQLHTGHIQDAVTQGLKALPNAIPTGSP